MADASQVAGDTSSTQEAAAMSTGKEMVSDANRRDCSARAERRVTGACEVAEASQGAWDAAALAGEVMSASLVQREGAVSAGKERSSEANRGDCSAKAEGRAAHALEVAASADAGWPSGTSPRPNSAFASAMSRSKEVSMAVTVRVELRLTPSWVTVRRERRDAA